MPDSPSIVLLLRFRDLVNPQGDSTIHEHQDIISRHGYVWWAWWKKQTERVPIELWGQLKQLASPNGVLTYPG